MRLAWQAGQTIESMPLDIRCALPRRAGSSPDGDMHHPRLGKRPARDLGRQTYERGWRLVLLRAGTSLYVETLARATGQLLTPVPLKSSAQSGDQPQPRLAKPASILYKAYQTQRVRPSQF